MPAHIEDWETRLGSDPWRNAIRKECNDARAEGFPRGEFQPSRELTPSSVDMTKPLDYECLISGTNPVAASYLVAQAGRLFIVGPTKAAATRLHYLGSSLPRHLQIVLLSWEREHWNGLERLVADYLPPSGERSVTIWTSCWIWEEVARSFQPGSRCADRLQNMDYLVARGDEALELNRAGQIMAFERNGSWNLTCGVTLDLSYTFHRSPLLRARFCCNNERLSIDPGLFSAAARNLERVRQILDRMQAIRSQYPDTMRLLGEIRQDIKQPADQFGPGWKYRRSMGFASSVDMTPPSEIERFSINRTRPLSSNRPAASQGDTNSKASVTDELVVLLMCGGLMNQLGRNLINPSHPLDIRASNSSGKETIRSMSILEWRLRQANSWHAKHRDKDRNIKLQVVVLTTSETEDYVNDTVHRLQSELEALELTPAAAQLIPGIQEVDGRKQIATFQDGGWILHTRGHMDALRLLVDRAEQFSDRKQALILAFNNLGEVFDRETTVERLKEFRHDAGDLRVELFKYSRNPEDYDKRWSQLSWTDQFERPRLEKESYSPASERTEPSGEDGALFYSSLTWYVNLSGLWEKSKTVDWFNELEFELCEGTRGVLMPRQDIDFISHSERFHTSGLNSSSDGATDSLYAHSRYLGVRTMDHVRHHEFIKKFEKVGTWRQPGRGDSQSRSRDPHVDLDEPIWELVPQIQQYPWGGYDIATFKGTAPSLIAETWEVSTYPHVQSSVAANPEINIPLNDALEGGYDAILKYVDCHTALSVQVHPSSLVARTLAQDGHPVRDKQGKDETFFVLDTAPGRDFHLLLGFDREKLAPLADAVRLILAQNEYASQSDEDTWEEASASFTDVLAGEFLGTINRYLEESTPLREKVSRSDILKAQDFIRCCMQFHVKQIHSRLSGNEFRFAGVAVIGLLHALHKHFTLRMSESPNKAMYRESMRKLFGGDLQERATTEEIDAHPILRLFGRIKVEKNSVIRIPAGTIHSLQGGGNRFIEIGHASDNTFRILDFGREPDGAREIHYFQAACSLNSFAFFDEHSVRRLVEPSTETPYFVDCHRLMRYQLWRPQDTQSDLTALHDLSFLMNPDGKITITAYGAEQAPHRREVDRMRTVAIRQTAQKVVVEPQQADNRIIHFNCRKPAAPLICLCPAAVSWESGIWRDEISKTFRRDALKHERQQSKSNLSDLINALTSGFTGLSTDEDLRVAVAWPGYVSYSAERGRQLYSSSFREESKVELESEIVEKWPRAHVTVLSDFQFSVLGELAHPMGRLSAEKPGMLINIGSGICVSFYHPKFHGEMDRIFRDDWLTVCSGVGRWLFMDEPSRRWHVGPEVEAGEDPIPIDELVFGEPGGKSPTSIRASSWFSAEAIVRRWRKGKTAPANPEERLLKIGKNAKKGATEFVITLADDLASVVFEVAQMLVRHHELSAGLSDEDYQLIANECPRNIVLTGFVGRFLGRSSTRQGTDLLTAILQQRLDELFTGSHHEVNRSDIPSVAERETYGALYFLDVRKSGNADTCE